MVFKRWLGNLMPLWIALAVSVQAQSPDGAKTGNAEMASPLADSTARVSFPGGDSARSASTARSDSSGIADSLGTVDAKPLSPPADSTSSASLSKSTPAATDTTVASSAQSDSSVSGAAAGTADSSAPGTEAAKTQPAGVDSAKTLIDASRTAASAIAYDSIGIEGLVLDSATGEFPKDEAISVYVDSTRVPVDAEGNFSVSARRKGAYQVAIYSKNRLLFVSSVPDDPQKPNIFITCKISKGAKAVAAPPTAAPRPTEGAPWTISGCIVDSRLDLPIKMPIAELTFDDSLVALTEKLSFTVVTRIPGPHTFHCMIPGYHEVRETIVLTESDKQPFVTIATTGLEHRIERRQITVSAKRQPVHATATVATVKISRKEMQRTAGIVNDPIRVLHTLPGVASESDLFAVPIVRGGDLLESRLFLDGIPLMQPFHFGGIKSMFNAMAMENISLYKSGFPAEYHNSQSALIVAESRSPADTLKMSADINMLQYCGYIGIPFWNQTIGMHFSAQGSYIDFIMKRTMDIAAMSSKDEQQKKYIRQYQALNHFPDYQDFSAGVEWKPSDRLSFKINNLLNTDRFVSAMGDTVTPETYSYKNKLYYYDSLGRFHCYDGPTGDPAIDAKLRDTSFTYTVTPDWFSMPEPPHFECAYDTMWYEKRKFKIDTMFHYKSYYNILYSQNRYVRSPDQIFSLSLAWQKRWWDLKFPDIGSAFVDTMRYDVRLDQWNAHASMLYSGKQNHIVKCGLQWDATLARFNVFTLRMAHEIISKGSTNTGDFWGPVSGDTGMVFNDTSQTAYFDILERLLVRYKGNRLHHNFSAYGEDDWTISPRLACNIGARIEGSTADTSCTVSPRLSLKYNLLPDHEIIGAAGLYTQNNYDVAALALSTKLKPEKVCHASLGLESKFLPWLSQKVDFYGKYYYDLISEELTPNYELTPEFVEKANDYITKNYHVNDIDSLMQASPDEYQKLLTRYLFDTGVFDASYSNAGRGWAAGGEYFLRFDPADFWNGWISVSLGKSRRQRRPGWRWHDFPFDRPLLISLVNYYRLPRNYEIGVKYRFMSGMPYTPISVGEKFIVAPYNSRRYAPYHALDMKFWKGFTVRGVKCHFYIEAWNMLNIPNHFLCDSKTHTYKAFGLNLPIPMPFLGLDCNNF